MVVIDIPSLGVQDIIPLCKKHTHDTVVQIEDEEPDISHNSTYTIGRMVEEKAIQVDILNLLIKSAKDKLT